MKILGKKMAKKQKRIANLFIYIISIFFANKLIFFFKYEYILDIKLSSEHAGGALPSCFGTGHVTVLSTPRRKMEYARVLQHRCSSAIDFCSDRSE